MSLSPLGDGDDIVASRANNSSGLRRYCLPWRPVFLEENSLEDEEKHDG